jgi:hypothetical protein
MSPAEVGEKTVLQDPTVPLDPIGLKAELKYYKAKCRKLELATEIKEEGYVWDTETEALTELGHDNVWPFVPNLIGTASGRYFHGCAHIRQIEPQGYNQVLFIGVFLEYALQSSHRVEGGLLRVNTLPFDTRLPLSTAADLATSGQPG